MPGTVKGAAVLLSCVLTLSESAQAATAVVPGEALYQARCAACHSVDANRAGPLHRNVLGRVAGSVPGFDYSDALRNVGLVWTAKNIDLWLQDPEAFVPGQAMGVTAALEADRKLLIDFLRSVSQAAPAKAGAGR
jgi:cytochrome c